MKYFLLFIGFCVVAIVVMVIAGGSVCHYCGNQVNLCNKCAGKALAEISALNLGL